MTVCKKKYSVNADHEPTLYGAEGEAVVALPRHYVNFRQHQDLCTQLHVLAFPPAPEPPIAVLCSEALTKRSFFQRIIVPS